MTDIKNANLKAKNNKLNKTLQNFMYTMLKDSSDIASKKSLDVMIDLYKKNIWNDAKTVNIISEAVFSDVPKIAATASQFFLNSNEAAEEESDDENVPDLTNLKHNMSINKKTKARKAQYEKALHTIKRVRGLVLFHRFAENSSTHHRKRETRTRQSLSNFQHYICLTILKVFKI